MQNFLFPQRGTIVIAEKLVSRFIMVLHVFRTLDAQKNFLHRFCVCVSVYMYVEIRYGCNR